MSRSATIPASSTKTILIADGRTATIEYHVRMNGFDYVLVSIDGDYTFYRPMVDSEQLTSCSITTDSDAGAYIDDTDLDTEADIVSETGTFDFRITGDQYYIRAYFPAFGLETPWMEMRMGFRQLATFVDVNDADYAIDSLGYLSILQAAPAMVPLQKALALTRIMQDLADLEHADTQRLLGNADLKRKTALLITYFACRLAKLCDVAETPQLDTIFVPIPQHMLTLARRVSELCLDEDENVSFTELDDLRSAARYLNSIATSIVREASSKIVFIG